MKNILYIIVGLTVICFAQPKFEATNSAPGEFSRMGFLPRGLAMGNALSAVTTGNLSGYYNPALSVFQEQNSAQTGYTFLSLDRQLNFLSFTRKFEFGAKDTAGKPKATAGLSLGIINSGVSNIDGRDNNGFSTGPLRTSENLFFLSFANKISKKVALGFGVRFYYYKLYEGISATGTGFDIGMVYSVSDNLKVAAVVQDLNTAYKWDTSSLFGTDGLSTTNKFPTTKKLGAYYHIPELGLKLAGEFEANSYGRKLLRAGVESIIYPGVSLRGGLDNFVLNNGDELIQPTLGFSVAQTLYGMNAAFEYAFVVEQYSGTPRHSVGLSVQF